MTGSPGDSKDFPGLGVLKCHVCHRPTTSHDIGPCPYMQTQVPYNSLTPRRGTFTLVSGDPFGDTYVDNTDDGGGSLPPVA